MDKHRVAKALNMQDNSAIGIRATIDRLNSMLQAHDPELWAHLEQKTKVIAHMPSTCMSLMMSCVALWCAVGCVMSLDILLMQVNPQFYAFRWITLLLTQEFLFPDVVRLWDSLFSDPGGHMDCLLRFCIAMLSNIREELLQGDFSQNIKLLQRYPSVDVHAIIHQAMQLKLASA